MHKIETTSIAPNDAPRSSWLRRLARSLALLLLVLALATFGLWCALWKITGASGVARLKSSEVGLLIDYVGGRVDVVDRPGYCFFWPWLQELQIHARSPRELALVGTVKNKDLPVRARDGSSFWFEGLRVHYQIAPAGLLSLATHLGTSDEQARVLLGRSALALLAEECGRLEAHEAIDSSRLDAARSRATERLVALAAPLGLDVLQLQAPKARFERDYERAIDERKLIQAESERLREENAQALVKRVQRLDAQARTQELERQAQEFALERARIELETQLAAGRSAVLLKLDTRQKDLTIQRTQLELAARDALATNARELEALGSELELYERRAEALVLEAWIANVSRVPIDLLPLPELRAAEQRP